MSATYTTCVITNHKNTGFTNDNRYLPTAVVETQISIINKKKQRITEFTNDSRYLPTAVLIPVAFFIDSDLISAFDYCLT